MTVSVGFFFRIFGFSGNEQTQYEGELVEAAFVLEENLCFEKGNGMNDYVILKKIDDWILKRPLY